MTHDALGAALRPLAEQEFKGSSSALLTALSRNAQFKELFGAIDGATLISRLQRSRELLCERWAIKFVIRDNVVRLKVDWNHNVGFVVTDRNGKVTKTLGRIAEGKL
jgi:hypothetical protein